MEQVVITDLGTAQDVGTRIKSLRQAKGLTQKDLIEPAGSASLLSLIESGRRHPTHEVLSHIASRLEVHPDELMTGRSPHAEVELELRLQEIREELRVGHLDEASTLAEELAADAAQLELPRVEAKCYEILASLEERRSLMDAALAHYQKAEALWSSEPSNLRFQTVAGLARCHQALGDPRYGVHILESYLLELEREGLLDPVATMRTHSALVICYSALGLKAKAAESAETAQALAPHVTDAEQLACMNMNVTHSLFAQGRMDDALNSIRQAELAYLSLGWEIDAAGAKLNRAVVQIEKGDLDEARRNLTEALEIFRGADHRSDAAKTLNELARVERLTGDVPRAQTLLQEAQDLLGQGDFAERGLNLRELGMCAEETDPEEAKAYLRRAIDLYMLAAAADEVASTYKILGDLHRASGEIEKAADAYRAGIEAVEARLD